MNIDLRRIQVKKLFGEYDFDIPINENTLILVGENGSGKSTLINIIYFALTSQWDRLEDLPFESCIITIGEEYFELIREKLPKSAPRKTSNAVRYFERKLSQEQLSSLLEALAENSSEYWATSEGRIKLRSIQDSFSKSFSIAALFDLAQLNPSYVLEEDEENKAPGPRELTKKLGSSDEEQVLFLPTYRRIEKELGDVFPNLNLNDLSSPSYLNLSDTRFSRKSGYIELVEFGMADVATAFDSTLKSLDQSFRSSLNQLTGSYLSDILQKKYNDIDVSSLSKEEAVRTLDLMLPRIGKEILSEEDRFKLRQLLSTIKENQGLGVEERISAHFLASLLSIHKSQQEREKPVRQLIDLINQYLNGKKIEFDAATFKLNIKKSEPNNPSEVSLESLSSGEKQIVSLFSHVFLSGYQKYFIVIDEPELSISVLWQKRFLQDLKNTGKCSGLIAVTHSPFVFENSLSKYAHSISEFIRES